MPRPSVVRAAATFSLVLLLAGCSNGSEDRSNGDPASTVPATVGDPTETATTTDDQAAAAPLLESALEEVDDALAAYCMTARASLEEKLTERLEDDSYAAQLADSCGAHAENARDYATTAQTDSGGALTQAQLDCLATGYAALPPDELDAILSAAVAPDPTNREKATAALGELHNSCGT